MIDLAPTLADLAGLPAAPTWQGRSLLGRDRTGRAYFFEPFSTFVFGMREGSRKILLNGTTGQVELYDLQYQEEFFDGILDDDAR